jgi:hypothetical protein
MRNWPLEGICVKEHKEQSGASKEARVHGACDHEKETDGSAELQVNRFAVRNRTSAAPLFEVSASIHPEKRLGTLQG